MAKYAGARAAAATTGILTLSTVGLTIFGATAAPKTIQSAFETAIINAYNKVMSLNITIPPQHLPITIVVAALSSMLPSSFNATIETPAMTFALSTMLGVLNSTDNLFYADVHNVSNTINTTTYIAIIVVGIALSLLIAAVGSGITLGIAAHTRISDLEKAKQEVTHADEVELDEVHADSPSSSPNSSHTLLPEQSVTAVRGAMRVQ